MKKSFNKASQSGRTLCAPAGSVRHHMKSKIAVEKARSWLQNNSKESYSEECPDLGISEAVNGIVDSNEDFNMADLLYLLALENESEWVLEKIEENDSLAWEVVEAGIQYHDFEARWQIAVLLGFLGTSRATPYLVQLCHDEDEYVRRRALLELRQHDKTLSETIAIGWLDSIHEYSRMVAVDTLKYINSTEFESAAKKLIYDSSSIVKNRLAELRSNA